MTQLRLDGAGLSSSCVRTLTGWRAPSPEQELLRRHYLDHLAQHCDGWARECRGSHLTASTLICAADDRRVLLTLHAKIRRWLQTGGHLEPDDSSLETAALREATEESGLRRLELDPVPLLLSRHQVSCGGEPTFHLDVQFLVRTPAAVTPEFGSESLDVRWFGLDALPDVDQSVRDLALSAATRLGWS